MNTIIYAVQYFDKNDQLTSDPKEIAYTVWGNLRTWANGIRELLTNGKWVKIS